MLPKSQETIIMANTTLVGTTSRIALMEDIKRILISKKTGEIRVSRRGILRLDPHPTDFRNVYSILH